MRRIGLRWIASPSWANSACRRSSVQWQVGATSPSAGLGGSARALAITWLSVAAS
jgi:hypothetical protein